MLTPMALYLRIGTAALLAVALLTYGFKWGRNYGDNEVAALKARYAAETAHVAELAVKAAQDARAAEHKLSLAFAAIDAKHAKELENANEKHAAVVRDLRSGALRLRNEWRCLDTAGIVPDTAAGSGGGNDAADLRVAGAADLVRLGARADADIAACQAVIAADRLL
jgi:hypothetical protein